MPLVAAAWGDEIDTIAVLLDYGADINLCGDQHATPLQMTVQEGYDDIIDLLIQAGADLGAKARVEGGDCAINCGSITIFL